MLQLGQNVLAKAPSTHDPKRTCAHSRRIHREGDIEIVLCATVAGDQLTKHAVTSRLALDESSKVIGPLSIHRVENSGIAFGLFTSATGVDGLVARMADTGHDVREMAGASIAATL